MGAFDGDRIVSIASFFEMYSDKIQFKKMYRLRAMATDTEYRRMGTGKAIIEKATEELRAMDVDVLWCNARKVALKFYLCIGCHR
ncbi:MAG: GNAT superfamily N-acetyltransferase [Patiriisocius sp.]